MINFSKLKFYCTAKREYFFSKYRKHTYSFANRQRYIYIPGFDNVLAVAHLDHVGEPITIPPTSDKDKYFSSIALDDRLGVYVILEVLPELGIFPSVLLTEDEEIGISSAAWFEDTTRQYNWMFQFDRQGVDVVMYQYDSDENRKLLSSYGFKFNRGSFSDICYLAHLGITGYNFGTAYWLQHSNDCFMLSDELIKQINRFATFYHDQKNTPRPWENFHLDSYYNSYYEKEELLDFCPYCGIDTVLSKQFLEEFVCDECYDILS